jgi:hypothetical protein
MTHEEEVVRTTYAKLSFAAQIGMLWHAAEQDDGWPSLNEGLVLSKAMNEQIRFEISGVKVGFLDEIEKLSWASLVEGPVDVLFLPSVTVPVGFTKGKIRKDFYITYADAAWKPERPSPVETLEERKQTADTPSIKEVLQSLRKPNGGGKWTRYASYSVVAMLRGRLVSYRAVFLFSKHGDHEEILPLDYATAMGIAPFINASMYPSALVDTPFRELPYIQAWIVANQISGCKKFSQPEVCCETTTGRCGLASEDVQHSLITPVDPDMRSILAARQPTNEKKGTKK